MKTLLPTLCLLFLVASCATNPAMETFPDRRIDRNLSNSGKVTGWSTIGIGRLSHLATGATENKTPFPWPFYLENPAVENTKSVFDQGLIGVTVPFKNEEENFSVVSLGWAPTNDAIFGFNNQYNVGLARRQMAGTNQAFDYGFDVTDIVFDAGFSIYLVRLNLATEIQLTDFLWIRPQVSAYIFDIPLHTTTVGNLTYRTNNGISTEFPLSLELALEPNKSWGLRAGYQYAQLGRINHTWDQQYYLGLTMNL
jgi:hypothetical protein